MATAGGETRGEINDQLGIKDLSYVISKLEEYEFPESRWIELGGKLHISEPKLETVRADNPQNAKACLRACLAHWLRWNYEVDEYGKPSLEKLAAAVEQMGLRDVADKITKVKKIEDFRQLITRFEALVDKIHGHLADRVKHQKLQAGEVVRVEFIEEKWKLSEGIPDEVSIDTLFNYIQDHYSFLNCSLIEAIVNKHVDKSSQLQEGMKAYVEEMNHFKRSQCLQDLQYAIENVENYNPSEGSDTSCKVVIKLIGKWDKMIINHLESFLKHYFEDKDVFNHLQITPKSVCISYLVPHSAVAHITTAVNSKSESMRRVGVFYFSINGNALLDEKDVNFNESLIEAVRLCEVYEVSLLMSLGADPCYEDSNGDKALELAKHTGNKEIMQAMATATDSQVIKRKSQEDLSDEKANKETTDENEKLKVVIQRLQDSNADLEKSLTASKREIEELQSQKKESEQIFKKLNESYLGNKKLKESLAESKSTLAKSKDELLALQKENDKLLAALAKSKEDSLISLTLQKEYDKFKELLAESKSTLANSKDESQKEYEKLKELLAESKNTLAKNKDESQVLQDKILSLGKEVSSLRNELVVKEKMLFEQTEQIKAGNDKIGQILQEKISSLSDQPPCIGACVDKSTQSEAIKNVHFHNPTNYEDVAHIPISKNLLEHFTSIRMSFGCMMYNVLGVIKRLKRPLDKLKEFLLCTYDFKIKSKLNSCSDISSLFHVIRGECSLTNIKLLKAVVEEFYYFRLAQDYIYKYEKTLQSFCRLLSDICKVDDLRSIAVPSKPQPHLQCITFILNWEPEEHVLKDIKEILAKITEPYGKLIIIKIVCIESIPHD